MSEVQEVQENKVVEEAVADNTTQDNEAVGSLIAESKKYRTRAQSAGDRRARHAGHRRSVGKRGRRQADAEICQAGIPR